MMTTSSQTNSLTSARDLDVREDSTVGVKIAELLSLNVAVQVSQDMQF